MDLYGMLCKASCSDNAFISITGGGGKTTLMENFASYLREAGKKVLITTTTKIRSPYVHDYHADAIYRDDRVLGFMPTAGCVIAYALENRVTDKWSCPPLENLDVLRMRYDVVLCEADGSKGLPLKLHTQRDPVVPPFCTYTISVMGLWGIGQRASDVCFGDGSNSVVDGPYLQRYIRDPEGLLKGRIPGRRAIVLNGAEDAAEESGIPALVRGLDYPDDVLVCSACARSGILAERIFN